MSMPFLYTRTNLLGCSTLVAGVSFAASWFWSRGDLVSPLVPTAILANLVVLGGPDGSGRPLFWFTTFAVLTLAVWTCIIYFVLLLIRNLKPNGHRR